MLWLLLQSFPPPCLPRIQVQLLVPESAQQLNRSLHALIYPTASKPFANPSIYIHPARWHQEHSSLPKHQDNAINSEQAVSAGMNGGGGGAHHLAHSAGSSQRTNGVHQPTSRTSSLAMADLEAGLGAPVGKVQKAGDATAGPGDGVWDAKAVIKGEGVEEKVKKKRSRVQQQQQQRTSLPKLEGSLFWGVYRAAVQVRRHGCRGVILSGLFLMPTR